MVAARRLFGALGLAASMLFTAAALHAQSGVFGKNKPQSKEFDWRFVQSKHFDVYYSEGSKYLADFAADRAESAYVAISSLLRFEIRDRVPFVVYSSHNDFQQTNTTDEYLREGIGGFTEIFKNRIVIPFEGDYARFRHVIHHELVHAVINQMFFNGSLLGAAKDKLLSFGLPLWFNEGLAEYSARVWDTESDMFLRDATAYEYLPNIEELNGYFAYRGGQSLWYYIAQTYGEEKIGDIAHEVRGERDVAKGFENALSINLKELNKQWQWAQRKRYWPDVASREKPSDYARNLTGDENHYYDVGPSISPYGDKIAFISNRDDFFDVFIMDARDGSEVKKLIDGQQGSDLEELHILTPGLSWSPDGKTIALSTKAGEEDAILLIDVESHKYTKLTFGLDGIFALEWSPKGDKLAFIGASRCQSDIYVYDMQNQSLRNVTDDVFSESHLTWSPDERCIYFSSDRGVGICDSRGRYDFSEHDLYGISLETCQVRRVLAWPKSDEIDPAITKDGKQLLFISDRSGIQNIYVLNLETGACRPITNSLSGIHNISLSRDDDKLVFSSFNGGSFGIFLLRNPLEPSMKQTELASTDYAAYRDTADVRVSFRKTHEIANDTSASPSAISSIDVHQHAFTVQKQDTAETIVASTFAPKDNRDSSGAYKEKKYKLEFSLDIAMGSAGYNTWYGPSGVSFVAFSDLIGDHKVFVSANFFGDLKNGNYGLTYLYLPKRIDYALSAFHSAWLLWRPDEFGGSIYRYRTYGVSVGASYPLDRFQRIDGDLGWYGLNRDNIYDPTYSRQSRTVIVPSLGFTYDTSLWGFAAPISGTRYSVNLSGTPRLGSEGISFLTVRTDYRKYFKLGDWYSIALRGAAGGSIGTNPQKFMLGGMDFWLNRTFEGGYIPINDAEDFLFLSAITPLRGYNYAAAAGSRYAIANFEFRYPFFAFLQLGPLPLALQGIMGAMFVDVGGAWNKERDFVAFTHTEQGNLMMQDLKVGMGTGTRIYFLGFLVKLDVAWAWNIASWSPPKYYLTLGPDL